MDTAPFPYAGPETLRAPLLAALAQVVDPELALSIVDIGLVRDLSVDDGVAHVRMTMTSAACPVTDLIVDDVHAALDRALPPGRAVEVVVEWEPPWTPDSMSERARRFLQG